MYIFIVLFNIQPTIIKIEFVEFDPFNEIAERFRLKTGQLRIHEFPVQ